IRNALEVMRLRGAGIGNTEAQRAIIERQVRQLARLTDDLLDVSRITRGKVLLRREPLDLARLVRTTLDDHRSLVDQAGLTLELQLPVAPLAVDGDPARLAQVVGNLLQNAVKFTNAGGRVTVSLATEGAA